MKHFSVVFFSILLTHFICAQNQGTIIYNETTKIEMDFEGMDDKMKSMLPESQSIKKELQFSGSQSLYQNVKGEKAEDLELTSDDGSFQIKIQMGDKTEEILYIDHASKTYVHQKGMMGKAFVVSDPLDAKKWKLTNEKIKYLGYECQKAVIEEEDNFVVAWFTTAIPSLIGPDFYGGLPGAILLVSVNDGKKELKALSVDLKSIDNEDLKAPKKGKKVNNAEYEKIKAEKEAEMLEMYGGKEIKIRN